MLLRERELPVGHARQVTPMADAFTTRVTGRGDRAQVGDRYKID